MSDERKFYLAHEDDNDAANPLNGDPLNGDYSYTFGEGDDLETWGRPVNDSPESAEEEPDTDCSDATIEFNPAYTNNLIDKLGVLFYCGECKSQWQAQIIYTDRTVILTCPNDQQDGLNACNGHKKEVLWQKKE